MREIRTSGLMSGDGKRSVAAWPKPPRPSSTLPLVLQTRPLLCLSLLRYETSRVADSPRGRRYETSEKDVMDEAQAGETKAAPPASPLSARARVVLRPGQ